MENEDILDLPVIGRAGTLQSVDETARTFEVLWTTGAQVRRYSWSRDEEFDEEELQVLQNAGLIPRPFTSKHKQRKPAAKHIVFTEDAEEGSYTHAF